MRKFFFVAMSVGLLVLLLAGGPLAIVALPVAAAFAAETIILVRQRYKARMSAAIARKPVVQPIHLSKTARRQVRAKHRRIQQMHRRAA